MLSTPCPRPPPNTPHPLPPSSSITRRPRLRLSVFVSLLLLPPQSREFFAPSLSSELSELNGRVREPWQTGNRTRNPRCCRETGPGVRWCKVKAKKEAEKAPEFELVMRVENPNVSFFFSTKKEIETQNATKICFHATTSAF